MKLNYFGLLSGLRRYWAIIATMTIRMMLVTADTAEAPDCMIFATRISLDILEHALSIVLSVKESVK